MESADGRKRRACTMCTCKTMQPDVNDLERRHVEEAKETSESKTWKRTCYACAGVGRLKVCRPFPRRIARRSACLGVTLFVASKRLQVVHIKN